MYLSIQDELEKYLLNKLREKNNSPHLSGECDEDLVNLMKIYHRYHGFNQGEYKNVSYRDLVFCVGIICLTAILITILLML